MSSTSPTLDTLHNAAHLADRTADQVADRADQAIRSTQRAANATLDSLAGSVQDARSTAVPKLERLGADAEALARRGIEAAKARAQQIREQAEHTSEVTVSYIRDEPVKSVLIAAATGAALMALIALFSRSRA